ncbi:MULTISPECIES: pRL2-11 [unclassified Streptomyces]|uniref:pRL2-11 n=1 Tax=unclassified Streptomyces TaxID=2593676 RepID=UPI0038237B66
MMARKAKPQTNQNEGVAEEILAGLFTAVPVLSWRFLTGAPMDGQPRTNATWTHRGTRTEREDGRQAHRWDYLARLERAGYRVAGGAAVAGTGYGYAQDPTVTLEALQAGGFTVGSAASAWVGYRLMDGAVTWRHQRDWVWPLHVALREKLGYPEGTKPSRYIHVPVDYANITGDAIRIDLPADFAGEDGIKATVKTTVTNKLALQDVTFSWHTEGKNHHVLVKQSPRPPSKVLFSDPEIQKLIERMPESAPLIGLSHRGRAISVDLDAESPHVLVSAGTGGGKSVILRAIFAQLLRNGAEGAVLDRKRHSHKWVRGLSGVAYHREIADIHDALVALGEEGERRNRIVDAWEGDDREAPVGPRMALLLEEANATIGKLKRYWASVRKTKADEDGPADPKESPALDALGEILFMGRAVKMHVLMVAQSATANALGGPEMRENFATRILARYTRNAWNMLVPEVQPAPKSTRHVGRAQVVLGGVANETQVVFFTDAEARAWAELGRGLQGSSQPSQGHTHPVDLGKDPMTVSGSAVTQPLPAIPAQGGPGALREDAEGFKADMEALFAAAPAEAPGEAGEPAPDPDAPVTLKEAVDKEIVSVSLSVLRKESSDKNRGKEFPPSVGVHPKTRGKLYRPSELQRWERNRPKAGQVAESGEQED